MKRIHSGDKLIEYAVTYINHDGTHVSKEEVGESSDWEFLCSIRARSICFFYAWFKYYKTHGSFEKERQYLLYLYTASIWMYSMDLACKYMHLSTYEEDGVGHPTLLYQYDISDHISKSLCPFASVSSMCILETVWIAEKQTKTDETSSCGDS